MDFKEIFTIIASIIVPMFGAFAWLWSRLDKRFDKIDERFEKIEGSLEQVKNDIRSIDGRLCRLEGQDEERFRNEIRLIAKGD